MQTLIPSPVTATARPRTYRRLRWFARPLGYAATPRALLLLAAGVFFAIPEFFHPHRLWLLFLWDGLMVALLFADALLLPVPSSMQITRRFLHSPQIGMHTEVALEATHTHPGILDLHLTDDLHPSLLPVPKTVRISAYPRDTALAALSFFPRERGDLALGKLYLRYRGALGLAERWAIADLDQTITVHPATEPTEGSTDLYLMRARQIELEKRKLRRIGIGREFENLRDYQPGDELRNISWTATARRSRLITRQYTTERSQQVWIVLDAGRLSRTNYRMVRKTTADTTLTQDEAERGEAITLSLTQLDQATVAAVLLAKVVTGSGDKFALLTYGRRPQQQILPGTGATHLRLLIDALAHTRSESAEADHLQAATRLKGLQRRRGLILWITEMAETAGRPDIAIAAADLARRHLVVLVLLQHPELNEVAAQAATSVQSMFVSTAAQEMLNRRRATIASLRAQGVLVVETTPAQVASDAINQYLEVKAQGRI